MAKTIITKSDVERHRILFNRTGLPTEGRQYLILDGTREQLESWQPWIDFKAAKPNYVFYYINFDEENGDPLRYDIVNYAQQLPPEMGGSLMGSWAGLYPGDSMLVAYNDYTEQMGPILEFIHGNIENMSQYIVIDDEAVGA
jgi:hypothetical protein